MSRDVLDLIDPPPHPTSEDTMTSPDRLLSAIRAALDATERLAQATLRIGRSEYPPEWTVDGEDLRPIGVGVARTTAPGYIEPAHADHIARHDPATVLRWVTADRRVFARHQPHITEGGQTACEHCPADYEDELTPWPCPDFRDLADRLGIDPEETP